MDKIKLNDAECTQSSEPSVIQNWALFYTLRFREHFKRLWLTEERFLPNTTIVGYDRFCKIPATGYDLTDGEIHPILSGPRIDLSQSDASNLVLDPPIPEWAPMTSTVRELLQLNDQFGINDSQILATIVRLKNKGRIAIKEITCLDNHGLLVTVPGITFEDAWRIVVEFPFSSEFKHLRTAFRNLTAAIDRGRGLIGQTAIDGTEAYSPSHDLKQPTVSADSFSIPEGTKWCDLKLKIVNDSLIQVSIGGARKKYDMGTLGLRDKRTGELNDQGRLLKLFANHQGKLIPSVRETRALKQKVYRLRVNLKAFFKISGDPLPRLDRNPRMNEGWMTAFRIEEDVG